jgi:hypothetical protein
MNDQLNFDHTVLGELITRRWQEDPAYCTLSRLLMEGGSSLHGCARQVGAGWSCTGPAGLPCIRGQSRTLLSKQGLLPEVT